MKNSPAIAPEAPKLPHKPWQFAWYFYKKKKWSVAAIFLFEAGEAACMILLSYAIKGIIEAVTLANDTGIDVFEAAHDPFMLFIWLNIGIVLFSRASGSVLVMTGPRLRAIIRKTIFRYLQFHSHRYFISHFAGSLANRISEVAMSCMHGLWAITFNFYPLIIKSAVSLGVLYSVSPELAGTLALWLSVYVAVSFTLARKCQLYSKDAAAARSKVTGKIVDAVTNILTAKMFSRRLYEEEYLDEHLEFEVKQTSRNFWFMEKMRWFQFTAAMILMIGMVGYALKIWAAGDLTVGEFAMVTSIAIMLVESARGLSRSFLELFEYVGNISDGVSIFIQNHEVLDKPDAKAITVTKGEIQFKDLSFTYKEGLQVFEDMNVTINPGEKVGLVGFSGSGKSTFVNLTMRLFEPEKGAIYIDKQNIADVTQDSLRGNISMIPQDPMLFHRTLMENIRYGRLEASDEEVIEAAKKAHAHEFILATEKGYDSLVGERGIKLSGGQRQRIAIARAILKNSPILILDEATSALDSVTEKKIQQGLEYLMQNRTVVVVAHRLSTIAHLDRILVFHEGRIIEDGSHDELLAKEGHYARLWHMQAGGFLPEKEVAA